MVARKASEWNTHGNIGLVVGATCPEELKTIREQHPDMPLLIPGIGAQGGDLALTVRYGTDRHGEKAVINSSRQILYASREKDFATAALLCGASRWRILWRHLLPSFMSHIIVSITLAVPGMILGETALSFLGLGLRPPITSWGVLLKEAQNVQAVALHPWLLTPVIFVILTVLSFNFVGDGLRDAADPYAR